MFNNDRERAVWCAAFGARYSSTTDARSAAAAAYHAVLALRGQAPPPPADAAVSAELMLHAMRVGT